jgi:dipeptidyl aminopeptidase/acylaminoacyl peptidase
MKLSAQKLVIDSSTYGKWQTISGISKISNDGDYVMYQLDNVPILGHTLVIQALHSDWKIEIVNSFSTINSCFSKDNHYGILFSNDTIGILELGTSNIEYIFNVASFNMLYSNTGNWLIYHLKSHNKELHLRNLFSRSESVFKDVTNYLINEEGTDLIMERNDVLNKRVELALFNLSLVKSFTYYRGSKVENIRFSRDNKKIAFETSDDKGKVIWYYQFGWGSARRILDNLPRELNDQFAIGNIEYFTEGGEGLIFNLNLKVNNEFTKSALGIPKVSIWSYQDTKLHSQAILEPKEDIKYKAILKIKKRNVVRLEYENEHVSEHKGNSILISKVTADSDLGELNWNPACQREFYLFSINSGLKFRIDSSNTLYCALSPHGKYVVYYDWRKACYFSYNTTSQKKKMVGVGFPLNKTNNELDLPNKEYSDGKFLGWSNNDSCFFLSDYYDIWRIDAEGEKNRLINITNGYGRKHNINFDFIRKSGNEIIKPNDTILLTAFNKRNKENGFFFIENSNGCDPTILSMGPFVYNGNPINGALGLNRAKNANVYIVYRETEMNSRNIFVTSSFKEFTQLSFLSPEKRFNWLTTELLVWNNSDGEEMRGILYKPEDFNPEFKYPIIINVYETKSDNLHKFLKPDFAYAEIDIPTFVSRGYLVFTPDIHYKIGEPGISALKAVTSAVANLVQRPWINQNKIGIQGHSFGGYETNFIITHTDIFAAAMSAAGISNFISDYGSTFGNGASKQGIYEMGQSRMGTTLWEQPDLYWKNSPIFRANYLTTPLLLMSNKDDGAVPFSQGVEFFVALRRLRKKVWMLQYDGEGHIIMDNDARKDYTNRLFEFFDFYLKDRSMPEWMKKN